jgi:catalase
MHNFQRDGHMQMGQLKSARVSYEPSGLDADGPREQPKQGYQSVPEPVAGDKLRVRSESFADHYSQARQFFHSQTKPEQDHIVAALTFELSKVETAKVRTRLLSRLLNIDQALAKRVADGLGHTGKIEAAPAAKPTRTDLPPSKALSILANFKPSLKGRMLGCLVSEDADMALVEALREAVKAQGGMLKVVAPRIGLGGGSDKRIEADFQLAGGPSVLFDAVALVIGKKGAATLLKEAAARNFVADAYAHLKVIGHTDAASELLATAGAKPGEEGVVALDKRSVASFLEKAAAGRIWEREPSVRQVH